MSTESRVKLTHIVYQFAPGETIPTECRFYNSDDQSVRDWMRAMRADNPGYQYRPVQI